MRRKTALLIAAATLVGLIIRLNGLGRFGLETDEGIYIWIAEIPLALFPDFMEHDSAAPLYFVLLKGWRLFFDSDFSVRLLSVVFGVLAIPMTAFIARRLTNDASGVAAAFFMAAAPFHIRFSQISKNLTMLFFLVQVALLILLVVSRGKPRRSLWSLYAFVLALLLYTHGIAPFFIAGLAAVFFLSAERPLGERLKPWLYAHIAAGLLYLPWMGVALPQASGVIREFWSERPGIGEIAATIARFHLIRPTDPLLGFGESASPDGILGPTSLARGAIQLSWYLPVAAAMTISVFLFVRTGRSRTLAVLLALFAIPVGGVWLISQFSGSIYLDRVLLPALIPIPILLGAPFSFDGSWSGGSPSADGPIRPGTPLLRRIGILASGAAFPVVLYAGWDFTESHPPTHWREAVAHIESNAREGDALVFNAHFGEILFERYAGRRGMEMRRYGLPRGIHDEVVPDMSDSVASEGDLGPLKEAARRHRGIWLVLSHLELHDSGGLAGKWCDANMRLTDERRFVGVVLLRYEAEAAASEPAGLMAPLPTDPMAADQAPGR